MKNSDKDDIFKNFKNLDDSTVEEISHRVPFLDSAAKERIARECEMKINMKDNKTKSKENDNNEHKKTIVDSVEVYHSKWYRSAIAAAACFVLIIGVAAGGAVIKSNRNIDNPGIIQTQPSKQSVISSQTSSPSTNENNVIVTKPENPTQTALTSVPNTTDVSSPDTSQSLQTTQQSSNETTSTVSQSPYIDEDIIRNLINENTKCRIIYNTGNLPYTIYNPIIKDGVTYYEITSPEYSSFSQLEDYIRSVYTSDAAEEMMFNRPYENCQKYADINGKLYLNNNYMGGKGYHTIWDDCTIQILSTEGNSCTFKATGKSYPLAENPQPEDYTVTQTLIYENGGWKLQGIFN